MQASSSSHRQAWHISPVHVDDEEENSLLPLDSRRNPAVPIQPWSSSPSLPRSLSNDIVVCHTAWRRLSFPTRSTLLIVVVLLLVSATYEFAVNEGVREQEIENKREQQHHALENAVKSSWKVFGGGGDRSNNNDNTYFKDMHGSDSTTEDEIPNDSDEGKDIYQTLSDTRARAQELISTLNDYYGGQEKASAMLVKSWQAQWMLDDEYSYSDGTDNDKGNRELRRIKRSKGRKNQPPDDNGENGDDEEKEKEKEQEEVKEQEKKTPDDNVENDGDKPKEEQKKKKDKVKQGKVVENPEDMSPEELEQHHCQIRYLHRHYQVVHYAKAK